MRFDDLGGVQFERLCAEIVRSPGGLIPKDARVVVAWVRRGARLEDVVARAGQRPAVVLTNAREEVEADRVLGPDELAEIVLSRPDLRLRVPSVLGIYDVRATVDASLSTLDLDAALELARVFVPTRAYARACDALARHRFAVITGPPEMGKTAIARTIALAKLTDAWEAHECVRPEELWERYARDRAQVFVADDAFGSTEYRPEAAERWALELDRILRAMDERHFLIWTSRPAPLKAALRRIHREHGVERWPQPAEVHVDASDLDVEEKALILFRHAKAARLVARELVRAQGWEIVSHDHFTPERIRRFVARLPQLEVTSDIGELVAREIREPTEAMTASFRALAPEHRALLVAMLDAPPGPVSERALAAATRRHSESRFVRPPHELVDRLTDHFLRVLEGGAVRWVHPSWRDLVIEELARDPAARRAFLRAAGIDGVLLALSTGGGAAGERVFPLLSEDADWDAVGDRLAELAPDLDEPDLTRLFATLAETRHVELDALARQFLELLARRWAYEVVPAAMVARWFDLAAALADPPDPPELAPTWIELEPTDKIDLDDAADLARLEEWLALAFAAPTPLAVRERARALVEDVAAGAKRTADRSPAHRRRLARLLASLAELTHRVDVLNVVEDLLATMRDDPELPSAPLRPLSPEVERWLDMLATPLATDEELVEKVLDDL